MHKIADIYISNYKKIIRLGTPIVIGQLGNVILGFIDTMMVGQYSASALSASGFVNNLFNLGIIALLGFSYGATPIIGAYFGRKENDNVGASFKDSIWANSIAGLVVFGIYSVIYFNLGRLGQPEELLPLMSPYFLALLFSLPFTTMFNTLKQFTDTVAATKTAMWVIMIGNFLNIILNYLLIYGISIFPELGLTGAGIATLTARIAMVAMFIHIITYGNKLTPNPTSSSTENWEISGSHILSIEDLSVNTHYIYEFVELTAGNYGTGEKIEIINNEIIL
jgi:MATE family multidrug resistance protein